MASIEVPPLVKVLAQVPDFRQARGKRHPLPPARTSPPQLLTVWREHWAIENQRHYVRDVTFDADRAGVWKDHIPQVMAALSNAAIGLARLTGQTNIAAACRSFAARPAAALAAIGLPA